jgi:tRNA (guanine-N7-)-methyltransferase
MEVLGRPTPQPGDEGRPRFRDTLPTARVRSEVNPFLTLHRTFDPMLLPASEAHKHRGAWAELFGREAPMHLEIGCGNGFFLTELARRHPDWNVVAIELRFKRTVLSMRKAREAGLNNVAVLRYHAAFLDDLFTPGSLSGVWLNHPDPWPKDRHSKHRLIAPWFIADLDRYLTPDGTFRLKTDHHEHVQRLDELLSEEGAPLGITGRCDDVNALPVPWEDEIETNYQRKFREKGLPVYAVHAARTGSVT